METAAAARPAAVEPTQRIVVRSSTSPSDLPLQSGPRPEPRSPAKVAAVTFDAMLGNWDADVATDGLLIQFLPLDGNGEPVAARGVLNVELYSMQRVDQDAFAHGRGRHIGLVDRWTHRIDFDPERVSTGWIRVPFQATHPEFDVDWAPYGLVHIEMVVAGQGVFQHSVDGIRIRPWAPLRDAMEAQSRYRFFPSEMQDRRTTAR
jgi:hypothetical protein